jgi:hypothetical protein
MMFVILFHTQFRIIRIIAFFFIVIFIGTGCSKLENSNVVGIIDVTEAFNKKGSIKLSEVCNNIEYIIIETTKESLVRKNLQVFANDKYIITRAFRQYLIFDRTSGNFIKEIGHYGNDPNGYRATCIVAPFDQVGGTIKAYGWETGSRYFYDLSGQLIKKIKPSQYVPFVEFLNNDIYAGFVKNFNGTEKIKIALFNQKDSCIRTYPNYLTFSDTRGGAGWGAEGWFYKNRDQLFFKELFNDTLFQVTANNLLPRYIFDLGDFSPPYEKQVEDGFKENEADKYYFVRNIYENMEFIFFTINYAGNGYQGFFDKKTNEATINYFNDKCSGGFINDIDNFIDFKYSSLNRDNELIGFIEAYKLKNWFNDNPEKALELPLHLQKLRNIKETDNPVIMIAKLKE